MRRSLLLSALMSLVFAGSLIAATVHSIDELQTMPLLDGAYSVSGIAVDVGGNPVAATQLGIHDGLKLMSYVINCEEDGTFAFVTTRAPANDSSALAIDILNTEGVIVGTTTVMSEYDFSHQQIFETPEYSGLLFPVEGSTVEFGSAHITNTADLGVAHYWTPETSAAYTVTEEQRRGLAERVADDMLEDFAENATKEFLSLGDVAFYTLTFIGATAACGVSHGVACAPAYAAMGKAWVAHAAVDAGFGIAGAANEALVEEGVYDEATGTYVKGALVSGKLVLSVVHGAHEAAGRVGELQGLGSHIGFASPSVQAGFAFHDAANLALGSNEVLDLLALGLSSDLTSVSAETTDEIRSGVLKALDLMWQVSPERALETALAILDVVFQSKTSTIPSDVGDELLTIVDLLGSSDLDLLALIGDAVGAAAEQPSTAAVIEPTRSAITGVPALSQRKSNGDYLIEGVVPGCGPVAAAMLLSYYARALGCIEFLRPLGSENNDLISVVEELRSRMWTFTIPIIDQAATLPWLFIQGLQAFVDARFDAGPSVYWLLGNPLDCYEKAVSLIQLGIPHVLHFNWRGADPSLPLGWHYAVVVGYRQDEGRKELIVNMGWGPRQESYGYTDNLQTIDMTDENVAPTVLVWLTSPEFAATEEPTGLPVMYDSIYDIDATTHPARLTLEVNAYPPAQGIIAWRPSDHSKPLLPPGVNDSILVANWYDNPLVTAQNTVLVLDTSGSMADDNASGTSKIAAARTAASLLLDILDAENQAGAQNTVSVIAFSNYARTLSNLSDDLVQAREAVEKLGADGGTNFTNALWLANELLESSGGPGNIVLLSDGMPTVGSQSSYTSAEELQEEILDGPAYAIQQAGHCLFVIGFGHPELADAEETSINTAFLSRLAAMGSCADSYFQADQALDLQQRFVESHLFSGRIPIYSDSGVIREGERVDLGQLGVPQDSDVFYVALTWPGSSLTIELTDPHGVAVTEGYLGAYRTSGANFEFVQVRTPLAGVWALSVYGVEVPELETQFTVSSSVAKEADVVICPAPTPDGVAFSYRLPEGTTWAKIVLVVEDGVFASEIELYPLGNRFPEEGAWCPTYCGMPLPAGEYTAYLVTETGFVGVSAPFLLPECAAHLQ